MHANTPTCGTNRQMYVTPDDAMYHLERSRFRGCFNRLSGGRNGVVSTQADAL